MADRSAIQWTDATWNPVRGCVKVSPGCAHCYAETFAERFRGVTGHPYEQGFDLRLVPEKLKEPLTWKTPRRVFVNSMSDLFQDGVPDQFLHDVYHVMEHCGQHTFQVLTKRAARMHEYLTWRYGPDAETPRGRIPSRHIWHGVSVENQRMADERIQLLLQTPSAVRFISAEPLLEAVDLREYLTGDSTGYETGGPQGWQTGDALDWVIVGGESGPGARLCRTEWIGDIVKQCRFVGVPVFVKQLGSVPYVQAARLRYWEWRHVKRAEDRRFTHAVDDALGWRVHLHNRKGGDIDEWPQDLRVREFPSERKAVSSDEPSTR